MAMSKYFCLNCYQGNLSQAHCTNCQRSDHTFGHSHKLRVPTLKNKVKFRKFLVDTTIFFNVVPDHLIPKAQDLLRHVKLYNTTINGRLWTNIKAKK